MTPLISAGVETLPQGSIADGEITGGMVNGPTLSETRDDSPGWELLRIQAPEAWKTGFSGRNVPVAVLDTGIDAEHADLKGKVIGKTSFSNDTEIDTLRGHGTHIAGIIAASAYNGGSTGLAYESLLLDIKVGENDGTTDALKLARGMIWAVDHGAKILNISLVINKPYPLLEYAAEYAWNKGCIVVAAAGNDSSSEPVYPAAYPHVIAVAATDQKDNLADWSNRGSWVSLEAPGVNIYSALPGNRHGLKSGSSCSTALVSGEAALLYSEAIDTNHNGQVNDEVSAIILNSCDELENHTGKRINVFKAVSALNGFADN
jgi:thermitase